MALASLYDYGIQTGGYTPVKNSSWDWLGQDGALQSVGTAAQGLGALGGLYTGIQGLGLQKDQLALARDQYGLGKALAEKNLANQAQLINEERANATEVGLGLASHLTAAEKDAARAKTAAGNISGTL